MNHKAQFVTDVMKQKNVNGIYYGEMLKSGNHKGMGYVITVSKKLPKSELSKQEIIPHKIGEVSTDVIETGEIKALGRKDTELPLMMGDSGGHVDITAGTFGFLAKKLNDIKVYCVSNNHVFANVNKGKKGDPILKPGAYDGGTISNSVGVLDKFIPIVFSEGEPSCPISNMIVSWLNVLASTIGSKVTFSYTSNKITSNSFNIVDCALSQLFDNTEEKLRFVSSVRDLGRIVNTTSFQIGDEVWKSGRTTGVTSGIVKGVDYVTKVNMGDGKMAIFEDQYIIGTPGFSAGGDSGSSIHKKSGSDLLLGGLLFAGSGSVTIGNKISNVLEKLGVVPIMDK
jgi:hypothetical protein